jgi:hypothetical protein
MQKNMNVLARSVRCFEKTAAVSLEGPSSHAMAGCCALFWGCLPPSLKVFFHFLPLAHTARKSMLGILLLYVCVYIYGHLEQPLPGFQTPPPGHTAAPPPGAAAPETEDDGVSIGR